ncbi:MAG: hypothetical protein KDK40_01115, partial [Chlamydiia bacterium]|nr:hypothetical protein [Chlamydiia bacterium]
MNIIINEVTKKIVKSFIPLPHLEFLSLPCLEAKVACILQDTLDAESYLTFERRIASAKLMAFRSVADQIVYLLTKTKRSPREAGDFFRRLNELSDDELIDLLKTFKSWDRCAQTLIGSLTDFKNEPDTLFFALLLHLVMGNCPHPNEWSAAEFLSVGPLFQIFSLPIELGGYSLFIDAVDQPFRGDMESVVAIAEILRDVPQNNRKKLLIDALETIRGYRLPLFMHFERVLKELAEGVADGCENFAVGKKILSQVNDRNQGQMSDLSGSAQQYLQRISSKEHLQEVLRGVGLLNETLGSKGEQLFLELNALLDGEFISLSEAIELTGVLVDQRHALNTSHVGSWSAIIILLHAIPPTCRISRLAQALLSADQVVSADWLLFLHPEEIAEMMKAPLNSSIDLISAFKMSKAHSVWIFTCDFVKLLAQTLSGKKNLYLISFLRGLCKNTLLDCAGDEVPRWDLIKKLSKRDILASRLKRIQHLLSSELRLLNDYLIIAEWMDLTYPSSVDRGRKRSFDEMNSVNGEEKFLNRLCSALKSKTEINLNREGGLSRTIRILDQVLRKENERESLINATECLDLFRRLLSVHKEPWYESSLISGVDMIPRDLLPTWIEISALMKFNPQRVNLFLAIDCIRNAPEKWLKLGKAIAALPKECRKSVFELLSKHCDLTLENLLEMVGFCQTKEMVEQFKEHRLDWKAILSDSKGRTALGRAFANHLSNGCDERVKRDYLGKITSIESQQWRQEVVIVLFEELWKFGTKDFEVSLSILEEMSKECLLKEFLINLLLQYHDRTLINAAHLPLTNMIGRKVMTLKGLNWDESLFDLVENRGMFPFHLEKLLRADSIPPTPSLAIQKRYLAIYGQQMNLYLYEMEDFLDCSKGVFSKACPSVAENFFGMMKCISEASPLAAEALFKNESYVEQMSARFLMPEGKKWLEEYRSIIHRSCPSIAQWVQNTYRYEQEENRCLYTQASYFDEDDHLIRINCPPLWVKDHPVEALSDLRISIYEALQSYILNKRPITFYVNIFPSQVENNELTSDIGGVSRDYFGDLFKTLNRELVDNTTGLPKPEADLYVLFMMGYLLGFLVHNTQNITIGSVFGDAFYTVLCRLTPLDLRMGVDHLSNRRLLELTEGIRSVFGSIGAESEGAPLCGLSKFTNWKGD